MQRQWPACWDYFLPLTRKSKTKLKPPKLLLVFYWLSEAARLGHPNVFIGRFKQREVTRRRIMFTWEVNLGSTVQCCGCTLGCQLWFLCFAGPRFLFKSECIKLEASIGLLEVGWGWGVKYSTKPPPKQVRIPAVSWWVSLLSSTRAKHGLSSSLDGSNSLRGILTFLRVGRGLCLILECAARYGHLDFCWVD